MIRHRQDGSRCLPDFGRRESRLFSDVCRSSAVDTIQALTEVTETADDDVEDTAEWTDCDDTQVDPRETTGPAGAFLQNTLTPAGETTNAAYVAGTG